MRIYISGGITKNPNYMEDFMDTEIRLYRRFGEETEIFNPARICSELPQLTHAEYMKVCFLLIDMSDCLFFMKGWEESCGASQEHGYALAKGKRILYDEP